MAALSSSAYERVMPHIPQDRCCAKSKPETQKITGHSMVLGSGFMTILLLFTGQKNGKQSHDHLPNNELAICD